MKVLIFIFVFSLIKLISAGSDFLLINNSSERSGKGNAGVSDYSDISYALVNPASTIKNNKPQISFTYLVLNNNLNYNYLGVGFPAFSGTLSIHLIYLYFPNLSETHGGEETGSFMNYNDMCIVISDSFKIMDICNCGLSLKYIKSEISDIKASTYALDFGVIKDFNFLNFEKKYYNNLKIGLSIKNIGGNMKFIQQSEELPLTWTLGLKYLPYSDWSFLYDINKTKLKKIENYLGIEYKTPFYVLPRIGLKFEEETVLMTGIGFNYQTSYLKFKIDYSHNLLGQVIKSHSISLNLEIHPVVKVVKKVIQTNKVVEQKSVTNFFLNEKQKIKRIAVLDFKNTSQSEDLEYLAQTISESIATFLAKQNDIKIMDRKAVVNKLKKLYIELSDFQNEKEMKLLGRLLKVDTLIAGSFVDINNKLRINTRLIDIKTGDVIIADQMQSDADKEIFLFLDKIARDILKEIRELNKNINDKQ